MTRTDDNIKAITAMVLVAFVAFALTVMPQGRITLTEPPVLESSTQVINNQT